MHYSTVYLSNESLSTNSASDREGTVGRVISLHCYPLDYAIPEDSDENFSGIAKSSVENRGKTRLVETPLGLHVSDAVGLQTQNPSFLRNLKVNIAKSGLRKSEILHLFIPNLSCYFHIIQVTRQKKMLLNVSVLCCSFQGTGTPVERDCVVSQLKLTLH